jgi:hypothetical protein
LPATGGPGWTDWITAAATALTAIFAGFGGVAAWLTYRRDVSKDLPIVDADLSWSGEFILVRMAIRNQLPQIIVLADIQVKRPRGCKVSSGFGYDKSGSYDLTQPKPAIGHSAKIGYRISPYGSVRSGQVSGFRDQPADVGRLDIAIFPPSAWLGGRVAIDLVISDRASVTKRRRITIQRRMPPRAHNKTDDAASNIS